MDHFKFPSSSSSSQLTTQPIIAPRSSSLSNPISSPTSSTLSINRKKTAPTPLRLSSNKLTSSFHQEPTSDSLSSSSRSPSILDEFISIKPKFTHPLDERLSQEYNSIIINSKSSTNKLSAPSSPLRSMTTISQDSPQLQRARIPSFTQSSSSQNRIHSSQDSSQAYSNPILSSPPSLDQQQYEQNTIRRSNIGLGMPFSVSEASALHSKSIMSPRTESEINHPNPTHPDPALFSPICSPVVVDRTRLVGLGELATPRWSSIAIKPNRQSDHQSSPQHTEPISRFRGTTSDWNHQFGSPLSPISSSRTHQHHPEGSLNSSIDLNDGDGATPQLGTLTKKKKKSKNSNEASTTPRYEAMNWEEDVIGPYTDEDQQNLTTQTFMDRSSPLAMKQSQSHPQSDSGGPSKAYSHNAPGQKNSRQGLEDGSDHEQHIICSPPFSAPGRATTDHNTFERMPNSWTSNSFSTLPMNHPTENHDQSNPTLSSHSLSHPNNHPKHRSQISSSGEKPIKSGPRQSRGWDSHPELTEEPDKRTRDSISHVFQSPTKPTTQSSSNRYEPGQAYSIGLGVAGENLSNSNPFNNNKPTFPSSHFHHHSPSTIAHSILKSASSGLVNTELEVMDMEQAAAKNDDTAEALRKLDGLSTTSPRTSKQLTKESTGSRPTSSVSGANRRPNQSRSNTPSSSVSGKDKDRSSYHHHSSTKDKHKSGGEEHHLSPKKTRSRSLISSTKEQSSLFEADDLTQDAHPQSANHLRSSFKPPPLTQPIQHHLSSAPSSAVSFPNELSQNSNSPKTAFSRRGSQAKVLDSDVLDWKRGSTSSTGGTNSTTNTVESRDSTLATSVSASSFHPARSPPTKRRSSVGSEASSVLSGNGGDGSEAGGGVEKIIPPVPPLPKDYETYKGHTYSLSNAQLNHPQSTSNRIQSHSFIQLPSPRRNSQQTLDSPCSKSFSGIGPPGGADGEHTPITGNSESLPGSATSRFLHSFTTPKNSEELTDLPSPSTPSNPTTITSKANKKWSLSAALGINRSPSFTKEQQVEERHSSNLKKSGLSTMPMTKLNEMSSGPTIVHDNSNARDRTISNSSHQTDETSKLSGLSARRTPSGIPFFSRKSSYTHHSNSTNQSGPAPEASPRLESEGRKSMLGLNVFIRNSVGSRKPTVSISAGSSSSKVERSPIDGKLSINVHQEDSKGKLPGSNSGNSSGPTSTMKKLTLSTKASNLIGRRRGKTVSAADPTKETVPPPLPPMQMSAIDSSTIQRVDSFNETSTSKRRSGEYAINSSSVSIRGGMRVRSIKESTSSIRRGLLPTIDGSPLRTEEKKEEASEKFPSTPTKIPRAVFKTQPNKSLSPVQGVGVGVGDDAQTEPVPDSGMNEFGMMSHQASKRTSETVSLIPRTRSGLSISTTTSKSMRKLSNLDLKSSTDSTKEIKAPEEKSSVGSENTSSPAAARLAAARRTVVKTTQESQANRLASTGLNSSRRLSSISNSIDHSTNEFGKRVGVGGLASKLTLPSRMSRSSTTPTIASSHHQANDSTSSNQITRAKSTQESGGQVEQVSEEELRGDEEMLAYVARQKSKKLANGMSLSEINKLFEIAGKLEPTKALTTKEALRLYRNYLSDYEKVEILGFEEIYYVGAESNKKMANRLEVNQNFGYDDERGDYLIIRNDHLMFRYEIVDVLGKGSFGQVLQCRDHKTGEMVAIKIIRNKRRFHHQALVEIKVLENLLNWDPDDKHCVLKMTDHFSFRGHLCIVNELLSINLYELIRNNSFNGFSTVLIRRFTIQILQSLSLLRHHRVVHCDLKPENILLRHPGKSAIKTIDFGSSCFENEKVYTYIQSRFYRSPEVILGMNYHMAIDMWSLGCILAELYTGYPIFPGETESEQLACIMEVLGMPDKYLVDRSSRRKLFFDSTGAPRPVVNSKGRRRRVGSKSLSSVLKTDDELFLDFIGKCLAWDPERRLKPDPAMRHPWIIAGRSQRTLTNGVGSLRNQRGSSGILISSPRRKPTLNNSTTSTSSSATTTTSRIRTQSITVVGTGGSSSSTGAGNNHHHHNGSLRQSVPVKPVGS